MVQKPIMINNLDFENDKVMKDIKDNFKDEDLHHEKKKSFFNENIGKKILIGVLFILVLLYVLARVGL